MLHDSNLDIRVDDLLFYRPKLDLGIKSTRQIKLSFVSSAPVLTHLNFIDQMYFGQTRKLSGQIGEFILLDEQ